MASYNITDPDGKTYKITTMGKRYQNFFLQEFPYIVKVDTVGAP